jgi:hypothetical protein
LYAGDNVHSQHQLFGALAKHLFNMLRWNNIICKYNNMPCPIQ